MSEKTPFDYYLKKIEISSERFITGSATGGGITYDLTFVTMQVDIYEHIDKPYLTGSLMFLDNRNLVSEMNILGTEKVKIVIGTTDTSSDFEITKVFRVREIEYSKKSNDDTEIHSLHLIEEHAYLSSITTLEKVYEEKPFKIIEKIMGDELGREIELGKSSTPWSTEKMKMVIPSLTPLEACNLIKDRCNTIHGSPFYMWASLADDLIRFTDLENLIKLPPTNPTAGEEYWHSMALAAATKEKSGPGQQSRAIIEYSTLTNENHLYYAVNSLVNAKWHFYDTLTGVDTEIDFDMGEKYQDLANRGLLKSQPQPLLDKETKVNNKLISEYVSRDAFQISTSKTYFDPEGENRLNLIEEPDPRRHKLKVTGKALREWILKPQIQIMLAGRNFLRKNHNLTIGNNIVVKFLMNNPGNREFIDDKFENMDAKKSGEYMIYSTRHTFSEQNYRINLTLGKLSTFENVIGRRETF